MLENYNTTLIDTCKFLLQTEDFYSQGDLSDALAKLGYSNISQSNVSRVLKKLGAVKKRNYNNNAVYRLAEKKQAPRFQQPIRKLILNVKNNGVQIIVKTVSGAACLIAKIIENMGEQSGVLGCIASDNIVLVLPSNVKKIDRTTELIANHLNVKL